MMGQIDLFPYVGRNALQLLLGFWGPANDRKVLSDLLLKLGLLKIEPSQPTVLERKLVEDNWLEKSERLRIIRDFVISCFGHTRRLRIYGEIIYVNSEPFGIEKLTLEEVEG